MLRHSGPDLAGHENIWSQPDMAREIHNNISDQQEA